MHEGTVEKGTLRQTEVGHGVSVLEAFDIRPVLLSRGRPQSGQCGFNYLLMTVRDCIKCHLTLEHLREDLVEVGLLTLDNGAIRQSDAHRLHLHTGSWGVSKRGAEVEQLRPFSRVLGACNLSVRAIDERVGAISQEPALG